MKTVFQRALSVILCIVLAFSTTTLAFAADGDSFDYKTYAENAANENVHYLLDVLDDTLKEENINEHIVLIESTTILGITTPETAIDINLTSVDAMLGTLDDFRLIFNIVKHLCGDLASLNLNVLDRDLTRAGDGDIKVVSEFLEFAAANGEIIEGLLAGTLDLGLIETLLEIDVTDLFGEGGISRLLKEVFVDTFYEDEEDTAEYWEAYDRAMNDFDAFVYTDIIGSLLEDTPIEDIEIDETTTVDELITDAFALFIENYFIDLVDGFAFDFAEAGEDYAVLNDIIELDGDYDFTGIEFVEGESVLSQLNNVLGLIFAQVVPSYADSWIEGDYTYIGENVRGLVRYIAEESQMIKDEEGNVVDVATLDDDTLVLEIAKLVFFAADTKGEKEIYNVIVDTETLDEAVNAIFFDYAAKDGYVYEEGATYENVLGDYLADFVGDAVPLYDEKGNAVTAGSGESVWDVANYILNFYLVDKNLDALIGFETDKGDTLFDKLDLIFDLFADDGTADFDSEDYITSLLDAVFAVDLQAFVDLTAARALAYAGDESVIMFLYEVVYNILNNWTGSDKNTALNKYSTAPFQNTLSNEGIANIAKVVIEVLSARSLPLCMCIGLVHGAVSDIFEDITVGTPATCTENGTATGKYCATCDRTFLSATTVIPATGHQYKDEVTTAATCTETGIMTYTCVVCDDSYTQVIPEHGHTHDEGTVTTEPTCTEAGVMTYYCTVCDVVAATEPIAALGHSWNAGVVTKAPTCTDAGEKTFTCTVCGATEIEAVSATGHTDDAGTVTKAPTCTATGTKTFKCTVCGVTTKTENVPATGHKAGTNAKVTKAATCTSAGSKSYNCTVCGVAVRNEAIPATGHKSDAGKITKAATYEATGVKTYSCTVCKAVIKTETVKKLTLGKVTDLAVKKAAAKSITYTWTAVAGATGYTVQYTTNNGLTWNTLTVTSNTVTIKKLKAGTTCKVKVTATAGKAKSAVSDVLESGTKPAKVSIKTLTSSAAKKAVVTWKAITGANGYEVTYSTSKKFAKKGTKKVTVKKAKAKKTTLKKLKSGKKYFVKVRAYKTVNGAKLYGAWSKVKNVKVK